ncbi:MAG: FecR family protein [Spirochaetota bacterium]
MARHRLRFPFVLVVLLVLVAGVVGAQSATLAYAEDLSQVQATDGAGETIDTALGATLPAGTTIVTRESSVELVVEPSGAMIKVARNTTFVLERIDVGSRSVDHSFRLPAGKIRTVVQGVRDDRYRVRTPTGVAGVRGTDFAQRVVPGQTDWICVREGTATFARLTDGTRLVVTAREFADTYAETFESARVGPERLEEIFADVQFTHLDPAR